MNLNMLNNLKLIYIQKDDLENYDEINNKLNLLGFHYLYSYKNIPFYSKYTICKSIGDLINLYQIKYLLRQNTIPYKKKECIEVSDNIKQIRDYKNYSYVVCNKELKRLKNLYIKTKDPIYIQQQNEICIKKAQADYLRANHCFIHTKQYHMLPESAIIYQDMMLKLAKGGEKLSIIGDNQLSTSSFIMCIKYYIHIVYNGYGRLDYIKKKQLLNTTGRMLIWINNKLRPHKSYRQNIINKHKPEGLQWASVSDYCDYLNTQLLKLSQVTGDSYPKCSYIINDLRQVQFKVPSFVLTFY